MDILLKCNSEKSVNQWNIGSLQHAELPNVDILLTRYKKAHSLISPWSHQNSLSIRKLPTSRWQKHVFKILISSESLSFINDDKYRQYVFLETTSSLCLFLRKHLPNTAVWLITVSLSFIRVKMISRITAASLAHNSNDHTSRDNAVRHLRVCCRAIQNVTTTHTQAARRNEIHHFYSFIKDALKWNGLFLKLQVHSSENSERPAVQTPAQWEKGT